MSKFLAPFALAPLAVMAFALPGAAVAVDQDGSYAAFAPRPAAKATRIDYSHWDAALSYFVYRMGRSDRKGARKPDAEMGTRLVYGHDSRLRLEGNRVGFSFLEREQVEALTAYRMDLEQVATTVDIASLSRNEQLAYWINLHNVAVIEQIARAYPVQQPSQITIGGVPLDEAKVVTVGGVALSPRDIRTRIVYPNWKDPRVIYGFFRGEIGGPSIQRKAFNAQNLSALLDESSYEFVNSLRGTERRGRTLHVSTIYQEAAPFYFPGLETDLRDHLRKYSTAEVRAMIDATRQVEATLYERDISDLAGGEIDPQHGYTGSVTDPMRWGFDVTDPPPNIIGIPRNVARLAAERQEKVRRMRIDGQLEGKVIVLDKDPEPGKEVP